MWRICRKKADCPKLKNNKSNKKNPKKIFAKNITSFYCGKKSHVERGCFKRKRDAEQGIVKPLFKKENKEETTKTT